MSASSKILIIDDEEDFSEFVKWALEDTDRFEVVTCNDGPSGIALAREEQPELILLDINMPTMNGVEVADQLLHDGQTMDIPIAFVTGMLDTTGMSKRHGYVHGFSFITKPVTKNELLQQIDQIVGVSKVQKRFIESLER